MAYVVRIVRQRRGTTTRGWQARAYTFNPRYLSRFFNAANAQATRRAKSGTAELF